MSSQSHIRKSYFRERLESYLDSRNMRHTPERFAILETIVEKDCEFDVNMLCVEMERRSFRVARSTIYNIVSMLVDAGIIRQNKCGADPSLYKLLKPGATDGEITLICKVCGKNMSRRDSMISTQLRNKQFRGFIAESWSMTFWGLCQSCAHARQRCD